MALTAHLRELRRRLTVCLIVVGAASAVAFWWYDHGLGEFVRGPYCDLPPTCAGTWPAPAACWSPTCWAVHWYD
ncbi:hypothetical protein O2W15_12700 [Modestobacter sp. VKM Ac-2979]|uniref:hypothetical protein n=1 Tax=unclassified Modestobacter TaxID=2643866 RepID=UPI0022ABA3D9|nr:MULTISPECIES: hypothetical protein [unclassified Modestobacter]MCZ2812293.1 hypothetical protein [Modestobacter sp. VKM Ac-2979]MCZ2841183.1 hypothetical protein [Modestobacter sp. VKM Ac-2980]